MRWIIATRNPDKFREISSILSPYLEDMVFLRDFAPDLVIKEDYYTLKENALKKALVVYRETRMPTIAEDTGLFVSALDGAPGIFSARFAGESATYEENRKKLLMLLKEAPYHMRKAYFLSVVVAVQDESKVFSARGEVHGFITTEERGEGGFGYDPLFLYPPLGRTFAEIDEKVKNRLSHRFRALMEILDVIKEETRK